MSRKPKKAVVRVRMV